MEKFYEELRKVFESITPKDVELVHYPASVSVPVDNSGVRLPKVYNFSNALIYRVLTITPEPNFNAVWAVDLGIVGVSSFNMPNPLFRLKKHKYLRFKQINADTYTNLQNEFPNNDTVDPYHKVYVATAQYSLRAPCGEC